MDTKHRDAGECDRALSVGNCETEAGPRDRRCPVAAVAPWAIGRRVEWFALSTGANPSDHLCGSPQGDGNPRIDGRTGGRPESLLYGEAVTAAISTWPSVRSSTYQQPLQSNASKNAMMVAL